MARTDRIGKHATTVTDRGGMVTVKYHSTIVFAWDKSGSTVHLDSGGWKTVTTKRRINQAATQFGLPFGVYQRKGEWFVTFNSERRDDIPFVDTMAFCPFWSEDND